MRCFQCNLMNMSVCLDLCCENEQKIFCYNCELKIHQKHIDSVIFISSEKEKQIEIKQLIEDQQRSLYEKDNVQNQNQSQQIQNQKQNVSEIFQNLKKRIDEQLIYLRNQLLSKNFSKEENLQPRNIFKIEDIYLQLQAYVKQNSGQGVQINILEKKKQQTNKSINEIIQGIKRDTQSIQILEISQEEIKVEVLRNFEQQITQIIQFLLLQINQVDQESSLEEILLFREKINSQNWNQTVQQINQESNLKNLKNKLHSKDKQLQNLKEILFKQENYIQEIQQKINNKQFQDAQQFNSNEEINEIAIKNQILEQQLESLQSENQNLKNELYLYKEKDYDNKKEQLWENFIFQVNQIFNRDNYGSFGENLIWILENIRQVKEENSNLEIYIEGQEQQIQEMKEKGFYDQIFHNKQFEEIKFQVKELQELNEKLITEIQNRQEQVEQLKNSIKQDEAEEVIEQQQKHIDQLKEEINYISDLVSIKENENQKLRENFIENIGFLQKQIENFEREQKDWNDSIQIYQNFVISIENFLEIQNQSQFQGLQYLEERLDQVVQKIQEKYNQQNNQNSQQYQSQQMSNQSQNQIIQNYEDFENVQQQWIQQKDELEKVRNDLRSQKENYLDHIHELQEIIDTEREEHDEQKNLQQVLIEDLQKKLRKLQKKYEKSKNNVSLNINIDEGLEQRAQEIQKDLEQKEKVIQEQSEQLLQINKEQLNLQRQLKDLQLKSYTGYLEIQRDFKRKLKEKDFQIEKLKEGTLELNLNFQLGEEMERKIEEIKKEKGNFKEQQKIEENQKQETNLSVQPKPGFWIQANEDENCLKHRNSIKYSSGEFVEEKDKQIQLVESVYQYNEEREKDELEKIKKLIDLGEIFEEQTIERYVIIEKKENQIEKDQNQQQIQFEFKETNQNQQNEESNNSSNLKFDQNQIIQIYYKEDEQKQKINYEEKLEHLLKKLFSYLNEETQNFLIGESEYFDEKHNEAKICDAFFSQYESEKMLLNQVQNEINQIKNQQNSREFEFKIEQIESLKQKFSKIEKNTNSIQIQNQQTYQILQSLDQNNISPLNNDKTNIVFNSHDNSNYESISESSYQINSQQYFNNQDEIESQQKQ